MPATDKATLIQEMLGAIDYARHEFDQLTLRYVTTQEERELRNTFRAAVGEVSAVQAAAGFVTALREKGRDL